MSVDNGVPQIVQARTEALLRSLDATRRWSVVLFLTFVGLHEKGQPIMSLAGTDLRGINGSGVPMDRVVNGGNVHPNGAFTP